MSAAWNTVWDRPLGGEVPYTAQITPTVIRTTNGAYLQCFRLGGASFETTDDETLNGWHERLNALFRNLASRHVALWTHLVRRRESVYPGGTFEPGFAEELNDHYRERLASDTLMVNEWFVSVLYRPTVGALGLPLASLLAAQDADVSATLAREALDASAKLAEQILVGLDRYDPEPLALQGTGGSRTSDALGFLALLINGEHQPIPLPRAPLAEVLPNSRVFFGREAIEYRTPTRTRLGAVLGIKDYPTPTTPGLFNRLLTVDFPFVLTQSFAFLEKATAQKILVRALGGEYRPLQTGVPTGFNPLALPDTAPNREFLTGLLGRLVSRSGQLLSVRDQGEITAALAGTYALDPAVRRLSRVLEFLDPTDPDGVHARLVPWCAVAGGDYAWGFDQTEDRIAPLLQTQKLVGFDVTDFLDHAVTRGPVTSYLFHLTRQLLDGRRLAVWMDEFSKILSDPAFESFAKDGLKTWRKLNALGGFATQSPSDVLSSPIARTLVEQTATKVFFPNADANAADYVGGFGLSEREFTLLREQLEPGSRRFLVKSGHHSVVCELDLKGFDYELTVISGRASTVERVHRLVEEVGASPALWLPHLREESTPAI